MADTVTDPLEKAVLSGAIFAGPDPEGEEPRRTPDHSDIEDNDDDGVGPSAGFPEESNALPRSSTGPVKTTKGQSHNTGVKGVLADYRNRNNGKASAGQKKNGTRAIRKGVKGLTIEPEEGNGSTESLDELLAEADGLSDGGEQDARDAYRRKRIEEMKMMGSQERRTNVSQETYGHLREIGQSQFIKAIEDKSAHCVVVHVYDISIPSCSVLNIHLTSLARRYPYTKFLRIRSRDLEFASGDEKEVLPTLLVYRQGEVFKNLVAFDRDLFAEDDLDDDEETDSNRITRDLVEQGLLRHGVLQAHSAVGAESGDNSDSD